MGATKIEWADAVWNPTRGCSRVSPGCDHCYAMRQARRHDYKGGHYQGLTRIGKKGVDWAGYARIVPAALELPLRWKKPRRIFVNSMSDLFHESLTNEEIAAVFGIMARATQHDFLVLTKRAGRKGRLKDWYRWIAQQDSLMSRRSWPNLVALDFAVQALKAHGRDLPLTLPTGQPWPLPNVWLGVSVESADHQDRIDELLAVPAALHWVSLEPLLGGIDKLHGLLEPSSRGRSCSWCNDTSQCDGYCQRNSTWTPALGWGVVGGESGNGSRPYDLSWPASLVEQFGRAEVPLFHKQIGRYPILDGKPYPTRNRKGGTMAEWPEALRVRQWPREHPALRQPRRAGRRLALAEQGVLGVEHALGGAVGLGRAARPGEVGDAPGELGHAP